MNSFIPKNQQIIYKILINNLIWLFNELHIVIYNIQYMLIYLINFSLWPINQTINYK
jgi:hypothetical protein